MSEPKKTSEELTDQQLEEVSGGNSIDKHPSPRAPKLGVPASIAQGDTLDNSLTDDNLP